MTVSKSKADDGWEWRMERARKLKKAQCSPYWFSVREGVENFGSQKQGIGAEDLSIYQLKHSLKASQWRVGFCACYMLLGRGFTLWKSRSRWAIRRPCWKMKWKRQIICCFSRIQIHTRSMNRFHMSIYMCDYTVLSISIHSGLCFSTVNLPSTGFAVVLDFPVAHGTRLRLEGYDWNGPNNKTYGEEINLQEVLSSWILMILDRTLGESRHSKLPFSRKVRLWMRGWSLCTWVRALINWVWFTRLSLSIGLAVNWDGVGSRLCCIANLWFSPWSCPFKVGTWGNVREITIDPTFFFTWEMIEFPFK